MKRFVTFKALILVFALLLASIPVGAVERPFAANGNGLATFITDSSGNVTGANVVVLGDAMHLSESSAAPAGLNSFLTPTTRTSRIRPAKSHTSPPMAIAFRP